MSSPIQTNCPSCGAKVDFKIGSSMVVVCAYCRSLVGRGDRNVEDLGKVAALMETGSPLEVGLQGRFNGQRFQLVGRSQLRHPMGGIWDEWYAAFPSDRWGWLAEAQGRFYLTFAQPANRQLPEYKDLAVGTRLGLANMSLVVAEKSKAKAVSAEGEIPYRLTPGLETEFVDLSGPQGVFGTIDYGEDPPSVYIGKQVTLDELGISPKAQKREGRQVEAVQLNCPNCGAALALRAPDHSETVVCPSCAGILDINQGKLRFLKALEADKVEPIIPIGSVGELPEGKMTVIGMLQRAVTFDGVDYFWQEHLLYEPRIGFRWLVSSDDHWNLVQPVAAGDILGSDSPSYNGTTFKPYQRAKARVTYVAGECYWKVRIGEKARTSDFIAPPLALWREFSTGKDSQEVNWGLGTYMPVAEVEKAFGVTGLPVPQGVAPNQPFLYQGIYRGWGLAVLAAIVLGVLIMLISPRRQVREQGFSLQPFEADKAQVYFMEGIELSGWRNVQVSASSDLSNSWVFIAGDLINDETNETQPFHFPIEYYSGVDDGESWSEGHRTESTYLSAMPAGKYTLRLEVSGDDKRTAPNASPATALNISIKQGVPHWGPFIWVLLLLSAIPIGVGIWHVIFEASRWQNSNVNEEDGDDDD